MGLRASNGLRSIMLTAGKAAFNGGTIEVRTGTLPATTDAAATGVVLAELEFGTPAFGAEDPAGKVKANAINADPSANASGTPTWFRCYSSEGDPLIDGTAGGPGSGADMELKAATIAEGVAVSIQSFELEMGLQA